MSDEPKRLIREALLKHMREHPRSSDTPEGIRRWWLPASMASVEPQLLVETLEDLVGDGTMRHIHLPDGGIAYGLAPASQPEGC